MKSIREFNQMVGIEVGENDSIDDICSKLKACIDQQQKDIDNELEGTKSVGTAKVPDNRKRAHLLAGETKAERVKGSI